MRALAGVSGGRKPFSRNRPRKEVLADYLSFQTAPGVQAGAWKKEEDPSRAGSGLGNCYCAPITSRTLHPAWRPLAFAGECVHHTKIVTNPWCSRELPFNARFPRVMQITSIGDALR